MLSITRQHVTCTPPQRRGWHSSGPTPICSRHTARQHRTSHSRGRVLQSGGQPLSGLDLQDSWSAAGLAASASSAQLKPKLSMRPITTHVDVLLAGSSHYLGKAPYYSADASVPASVATADKDAPASMEASSAAGDDDAAAAGGEAAAAAGSSSTSSSPVDLHRLFLEDPSAWATQLPAVLLSKACREMVYTIQDSPGQNSTTDASYHIEVLLRHLLQQQEKDYEQLSGSMNLDTSLACGCLQHSTTACFYFLPPHGPSKVDLLVMSTLSQHVALLPVLSLPEGVSDEQAQQLQVTVRQLLETPGAYVEGLRPIRTYKVAHTADAFGPSGSSLQLPLVLRTPAPGAPQSSLFESLMPLLTSDEVYGLLDDACERYSIFCDDYEDEGMDLDVLISQLQVTQHMPSLAALHSANQRITALEQQLERASGVILELDTKVADMEPQDEVITALAAFMVGAVKKDLQKRGQETKHAPRAEAALAEAADAVGYFWTREFLWKLQPKLLAAVERAVKHWNNL